MSIRIVRTRAGSSGLVSSKVCLALTLHVTTLGVDQGLQPRRHDLLETGEGQYW